MCDIEVKSKKCKELTLYRCYYCCAHSHCSERSQRSKPIDSRPEGKPQEPLLVFFSRDNRPLNGIKLLTTQRKLVFSEYYQYSICRKSLDCKCQSFRSSFPLRMILFIYLLSCLRMVYRCTTKLPQGIKNFIRKCKVDTAGRLIKYHFDGYDCSARASATRNIYKASPLISDDRNVALWQPPTFITFPRRLPPFLWTFGPSTFYCS